MASEAVIEAARERDRAVRYCKACGAPIERNGMSWSYRRRVYCDRCSAQRSMGRLGTERECKLCGATFRSKKGYKYCEECRKLSEATRKRILGRLAK